MPSALVATSAFTSLSAQRPLELEPVGRVGAAGVGADLVARVAQQRGGVLGGRDGQRVDDAAARQLAQPRGEPAEAGVGGRQRQDAETQARPGERASHRAHRRAARAELLDHVVDDPLVGGGRRREHRTAGRKGREQVADAPVVGAEVVAPVADAVGLVDDQQPRGLGKARELLVAEAGVVQPLGTHQQQVDLTGGQRRRDLGPLVGVGGVHGHGAQPGPPRGVDLVAHQGQQRRDDQRRPGAAGAQQRGREEVDRRLAPPGALHDEHP